MVNQTHPVLLLTAWHFRRVRDMPLMFWRVRKLERHCRGRRGCLSVHRWVSRRSLLLTSHWVSEAAARSFLESETLHAFDRAASARPGAVTRRELRA